MWKAAWPASLVEDVLGQERFRELNKLRTWIYYPCNIRVVEIFVHSNTAFQVPWDWLHGPFLESAVAVLAERLSARYMEYGHNLFS
ncbi:hypothetical protein WJX82_004814 [Trebouxia sp. C0006]